VDKAKEIRRGFVDIWKWIGSPDCWFLIMVTFCLWCIFLAPESAIAGLANTFIVIGLVIIWHLARIAKSLEDKAI